MSGTDIGVAVLGKHYLEHQHEQGSIIGLVIDEISWLFGHQVQFELSRRTAEIDGVVELIATVKKRTKVGVL